MLLIRFIVYSLFLLSIFIYGTVNLKRFAVPYKMLVILLALTLVSELCGRVLKDQIKNSMPVYHIISVIEYICLTVVYSQLFHGIPKKIILWLIIPIVSFAIINTLFIQHILSFPSNFILLAQGIYLLFALTGFRQMLLSPIDKPLNKQSFFWLNTALLFFSTMLFLFFGLLNYINSHNYDIRPLYTFSYIINFMYYALLLVVLIVNKMEFTLSFKHDEQ